MKSKIFQYADMFFGTTDEFFGMKNKICQVIDNDKKTADLFGSSGIFMKPNIFLYKNVATGKLKF